MTEYHVQFPSWMSDATVSQLAYKPYAQDVIRFFSRADIRAKIRTAYQVRKTVTEVIDQEMVDDILPLFPNGMTQTNLSTIGRAAADVAVSFGFRKRGSRAHAGGSLFRTGQIYGPVDPKPIIKVVLGLCHDGFISYRALEADHSFDDLQIGPKNSADGIIAWVKETYGKDVAIQFEFQDA